MDGSPSLGDAGGERVEETRLQQHDCFAQQNTRIDAADPKSTKKSREYLRENSWRSELPLTFAANTFANFFGCLLTQRGIIHCACGMHDSAQLSPAFGDLFEYLFDARRSEMSATRA